MVFGRGIGANLIHSEAGRLGGGSPSLRSINTHEQRMHAGDARSNRALAMLQKNRWFFGSNFFVQLRSVCIIVW
jgi:hypothetical protein